MYETMDRGAEINGPTTSSHTAIPLAPLPESVAARVQQAGAPGVNLYRALAHAPRLLDAWIDFAWALREQCDTPNTSGISTALWPRKLASTSIGSRS